MFGGEATTPASVPSPDLLQGVQDVNRRSQGKQVERLQQMYKGGKGKGGARGRRGVLTDPRQPIRLRP